MREGEGLEMATRRLPGTDEKKRTSQDKKEKPAG